MFERSLLDSSTPRRTMPLAYALELGIVGLLVLAPLVNTRALTLSELRNAWTVFLPLPPPGPPPHGGARPQGPKNRTQPTDGRVVVPTVIPTDIKDIVDEPEEGAPPSVLGGLDLPWAGTGKDPVIEGIFTGNNPPPPLPQSSKPARPVRRIQVGGQVIAAKAIYQPTPAYPPLARMARIQGTVRLEAVISTEGRIQNLRVLSGHPLLIKAALEAVAQWRYQPTLLNGEPVEVLTEIAVNFTLAE